MIFLPLQVLYRRRTPSDVCAGSRAINAELLPFMQMLAFVVRVRVRRNVGAGDIYKMEIKVRNEFTFAHAYNIVLHRYGRTASNNSDNSIPPHFTTLGISFIPFSVGNILLQQL